MGIDIFSTDIEKLGRIIEIPCIDILTVEIRLV